MRDMLNKARQFDENGFEETDPLTLEEYMEIKDYLSDKMKVEYIAYVDLAYRAGFMLGYEKGFELGLKARTPEDN